MQTSPSGGSTRVVPLIENPRADRIGRATAVVFLGDRHFLFLPVVQAA